MDLEGDLERFGANVDDELVERRAGLVEEHVADLEEVALDAGERERVHPVAEVVPDAGMVMLVEIAHRDPLAEEGRVEEPDQPPALPDAASVASLRDLRSGDLARGLVVIAAAAAVQPEEPHHRQSTILDAKPPNSTQKP